MSKKSRWIGQALILSGALNIALIGVFFYFLIRDNPLHFSFEPKVEVQIESTPLSASFLGQLQALSFEHLVELLSDQRAVEQGYRVCDFAAAGLATFYDFDVPRALGRGKLDERQWVFDETTFTLYPGLAESDFARMARFAKEERYPYTFRGLLRKLSNSERDCELVRYFCHTPQFLMVERCLGRTGLPITRGSLFAMVCEGGEGPLERFFAAQEERSDFSDRARQQLLLDYVAAGSQQAAYLLLITDGEYALGQLEDRKILDILDLLDVKTREAADFVLALVDSPRGEVVCERARLRLAEYEGGEVAGRYVERPGIGELRPVFRESPPAAPTPSTHIVQPGESLWIIAQKYGVSIEHLMEVNGLQSSVIQVGKSLKIIRN